MQVGAGPSFAVGPGDTVAIPARVAQCVRNTGNEDLVFQCICVPRFEPQCYESLEND
jgi:mannose-6-phosphate isomerase-like protein (cupin superfamily)